MDGYFPVNYPNDPDHSKASKFISELSPYRNVWSIVDHPASMREDLLAGIMPGA